MKSLFLLLAILVLQACTHAQTSDAASSALDDAKPARSHDNVLWVTGASEQASMKLGSFVEQPVEIDLDTTMCPQKKNQAIDISGVMMSADAPPVIATELRLNPSGGRIRFTVKTDTRFLPNENFLICPAGEAGSVNPDDCFGPLNLPEMPAGKQALRTIEVKYFGRECAFDLNAPKD